MPIVRLESSVTVRPAVMSMVAKSAVKPGPSAITLPLQLAVALQLALPLLIHLPSAAKAFVASTQRKPAVSSPILMFVFMMMSRWFEF